MRYCKKCNGQIPNRKTIDGKRRVLNRRKFCLNCSPFGSRNTIDISINEPARNHPVFTCSCGRVYVYNKRSGHSRTKCNSCVANNQRRARKKRALEYKGGACVVCGYNKCERSLGFHHVDGSDKKFQIGGEYCRSWDVLKKELDKCVVLCANCHGELHDEIISLQSLCGTVV